MLHDLVENNLMEEITPTVFISYSHDSPEHKRWVQELASSLLEGGVDVKLDQWDLSYGDDVPKYMEKSVNDADRVLMICTDQYVHKADEGEGGVGYEAMIVTGELIKNLGTSKFIPIVKQESKTPILPKSVSTRFYINLSDNGKYNEEFDSLLRELHEEPASKKPPIGKNPFTKSPSGSEIPNSSVAGPLEIKSLPSSDENIEDIYIEALEIARAGDSIAWRRLVSEARKKVNEALLSWREKHEGGFPREWEAIFPVAIEGITTYSPLISIAVAGVESGRKKFNNQLSILDDILYPKNWNRAGLTIVGDFPLSMAFIYQGLHGAVCLETDQLDVAINMIRTQTDFPGWKEDIPFWMHHGVMGWPDIFEHKATKAWDVLSTLPNDWVWLEVVFGDIEEYQAALCAYYMVLNINEYASTLSSSLIDLLEKGELKLDIPLCFVVLDDDIKRKAYRMLTSDIDKLASIWRSVDVSDEQIVKYWGAWISLCNNWLGNVYRGGFYGSLPHEKLIDDISSNLKK